MKNSLVEKSLSILVHRRPFKSFHISYHRNIRFTIPIRNILIVPNDGLKESYTTTFEFLMEIVKNLVCPFYRKQILLGVRNCPRELNIGTRVYLRSMKISRRKIGTSAFRLIFLSQRGAQFESCICVGTCNYQLRAPGY